MEEQKTLPELVKEAPELQNPGKELEDIFFLHICNLNPDNLGNPEIISKKLIDFFLSLGKPWVIYHHSVIGRYKPEGQPPEEKLDYLYQFNEAMAESLGRLITLMEFSQVEPQDILSYYKLHLAEINMLDAYYVEENILQTVMNYARHCNLALRIYNNPEINMRPYIHDQIGKELNIGDEAFLKAGRIVDETFLNLLMTQFFDVHQHIISTHGSIPKENTGYDQQDFHKQLMELWLHYFRMMDLLGHNFDSIGRIYSVNYYLKNQTNEK